MESFQNNRRRWDETNDKIEDGGQSGEMGKERLKCKYEALYM